MIEQIKESFLSEFPNGWISFSDSNVGGNKTLFIRFGAVPKDEIPNGIVQNDPLFSILSIESDLLIKHCNGSLSIDPKPGSFLAMDRVRTTLRKKKAKNEEDVVKYLKNYFKRVRKIVAENADNVYGRQRYSQDYFS